MQPTLNNDLLSLIIETRRDAFKILSECSPLPGSCFEEDDHFEKYCSGLDFAPCNGVFQKDKNYVPSEMEIKDIVAFFNSRKTSFIWWTANKKLEEYDFQFAGSLTGIALDMKEVEISPPTLPSNLSIQPALTHEQIKTFSHVCAEGSGMGEKAKDQLTKINIAALKSQKQHLFVASFDSKPVATVSLITHEKAVSIWNLGTLAAYRNRGIGTALMKKALFKAKELGFETAVALLMPKGMAWDIVSKLGFKTIAPFPFYIYGTSAESLE